MEARGAAVAVEQAALGHDQVDARALDRPIARMGARQLAFQRAQVVDALTKLVEEKASPLSKIS
jgi:hypothetical protein